MYKLHEFCDSVLKKNPHDSLALWTLLAFQVLWGNDDFTSERWQRLHATGDLTGEDVLCAELYSELSLGCNDPTTVAKLLKELDIVEEAKPMLDLCRTSESERLTEWSVSLLSQLE